MTYHSVFLPGGNVHLGHVPQHHWLCQSDEYGDRPVEEGHRAHQDDRGLGGGGDLLGQSGVDAAVLEHQGGGGGAVDVRRGGEVDAVVLQKKKESFDIFVA